MADEERKNSVFDRPSGLQDMVKTSNDGIKMADILQGYIGSIIGNTDTIMFRQQIRMRNLTQYAIENNEISSPKE
jgi:hypothetical protein